MLTGLTGGDLAVHTTQGFNHSSVMGALRRTFYTWPGEKAVGSLLKLLDTRGLPSQESLEGKPVQALASTLPRHPFNWKHLPSCRYPKKDGQTLTLSPSRWVFLHLDPGALRAPAYQESPLPGVFSCRSIGTTINSQ